MARFDGTNCSAGRGRSAGRADVTVRRMRAGPILFAGCINVTAIVVMNGVASMGCCCGAAREVRGAFRMPRNQLGTKVRVLGVGGAPFDGR
eukprot:5814753-Prymnesium_polylepis.1